MEHFLLEKFAFILILGVLSQWVAWRFKFPSIIGLSVLGLFLGPVMGWIHPTDDFGKLVDVLVKLALAIILFDGGLSLKLHEFRQTPLTLRRLLGVGVLLTWTFGTLAAFYIGGLSFPVSLVLAAILIVTGPTVIIPLVRQNKLTPRMASLLKWEGIVIDPIGALLAIVVYEYFISTSVTEARFGVAWGLIAGVAFSIGLAIVVALGLSALFRKGLVPEYLKVPLVMSSVFLCFSSSNLVQEEAGLMSVTVLGILLGNIGLGIADELRRFKEQISIFLVSSVFIILTASLQRQQILDLDLRGILFIAAVLFLVRPLSVILSTLGTDTSWRERLLLAWIAPRGIVAASMAGLVYFPLKKAGYEDADAIIPLVFGVVFSTVVLHGFSLGFLARKLGVASSASRGIVIVGASPWSTELAISIQRMGMPVILVDASWTRLKEARMAGVPIHYGEILSESSEQQLDFSEMSFLLAATDNDAYNALLCKTFAHEFGRNNVFQTAIHKQDESEKDKILNVSHRGTIAFCHSLHYETLISQFYRGWRFKTNLFTDSFQFSDLFHTEEDRKRIEPVLIQKKDGRVVLDTSNEELKPETGDTLLSFVSPDRLK